MAPSGYYAMSTPGSPQYIRLGSVRVFNTLLVVGLVEASYGPHAEGRPPLSVPWAHTQPPLMAKPSTKRYKGCGDVTGSPGLYRADNQEKRDIIGELVVRRARVSPRRPKRETGSPFNTLAGIDRL